MIEIGRIELKGPSFTVIVDRRLKSLAAAGEPAEGFVIAGERSKGSPMPGGPRTAEGG